MVSSLFLVPTELESRFLSRELLQSIKASNGELSHCGFGPIVSGIQSTKWIDRYHPEKVFLLGIAGGLDRQLNLGEAIEFDKAICFGVGVGSGIDFQSASEMGWLQWQGDPSVADSILLQSERPQERELLTCCSASANSQDVSIRLRKHPGALAEDMEGFSVAVACQFAGIPLRIVRGISNYAGDRNKENWRIQEAMQSVDQFIRKTLAT